MKNLALSFLFLISLSAFAKCPEGALRLEFRTDYEPVRHVICEKNDKKHGPYQKFNRVGELVSEEFFENGVRVEKPIQKKVVKTQIPKISDLFKLLIPSKQKSISSFDNSSCKTDESKWLMFFLMKSGFTQSYKFAPKCQVEGSFSPIPNKYFDVSLKLKGFEGYKTVDMKLKLVLDSKRVLTMNAIEGVLKGKDIVKFKADYKAKIILKTSQVEFENIGGNVYVHEINKEKVNISQEILIK